MSELKKATLDVQHEIERRIRHERLDTKPMSRPQLLATAVLTAAAVAAAMCDERFGGQEVEQAPMEQTK